MFSTMFSDNYDGDVKCKLLLVNAILCRCWNNYQFMTQKVYGTMAIDHWGNLSSQSGYGSEIYASLIVICQPLTFVQTILKHPVEFKFSNADEHLLTQNIRCGRMVGFKKVSRTDYPLKWLLKTDSSGILTTNINVTMQNCKMTEVFKTKFIFDSHLYLGCIIPASTSFDTREAAIKF